MSKRHGGTAMVELAIIMPFLIILVFGIEELGRALYQEQVLVKSAASAARYMARAYGAVVVDEGAETCTQTAVWTARVPSAKTLAVTAGRTNPVIPNLQASDVTIGVEFRDVSGAGGECVITVSVIKQFDGVFGDNLIPMTDIGRITLNAQSEEVYIGE